MRSPAASSSRSSTERGQAGQETPAAPPASRLRSRRCCPVRILPSPPPPLGEPNSRVDERVADVHQQDGQEQQNTEDQGQTHDHGVVEVVYGGGPVLRQAGEGDGLVK